MDGTFSSSPAIFAQLYIIHVRINNEYFPQLWCLLPDKDGATYIRLFQLLKQEAANLNFQLLPTTIHIDFEMAVIQAVRVELLIEPTGCLFHFSQNILRHMQANGLQVAYHTNAPPDVRLWIRRMISLPLVPPLRIDQAFQAAAANAPNVPVRDVMNEYVSNTYVDANRALFPRATWNCYGSRDRTTNMCEGYHNTLNEHFNRRSPDPYTFVSFLQQQDMQLERRLGQLQVGAAPKKRKAKYVEVDEALDRLREQYFTAGIPNVGRLLQYMDAVAHQLYDVKH
jgi:hypothetical protein